MANCSFQNNPIAIPASPSKLGHMQHYTPAMFDANNHLMMNVNSTATSISESSGMGNITNCSTFLREVNYSGGIDMASIDSSKILNIPGRVMNGCGTMLPLNPKLQFMKNSSAEKMDGNGLFMFKTVGASTSGGISGNNMTLEDMRSFMLNTCSNSGLKMQWPISSTEMSQGNANMMATTSNSSNSEIRQVTVSQAIIKTVTTAETTTTTVPAKAPAKLRGSGGGKSKAANCKGCKLSAALAPSTATLANNVSMKMPTMMMTPKVATIATSVAATPVTAIPVVASNKPRKPRTPKAPKTLASDPKCNGTAYIINATDGMSRLPTIASPMVPITNEMMMVPISMFTPTSSAPPKRKRNTTPGSSTRKRTKPPASATPVIITIVKEEEPDCSETLLLPPPACSPISPTISLADGNNSFDIFRDCTELDDWADIDPKSIDQFSLSPCKQSTPEPIFLNPVALQSYNSNTASTPNVTPLPPFSQIRSSDQQQDMTFNNLIPPGSPPCYTLPDDIFDSDDDENLSFEDHIRPVTPVMFEKSIKTPTAKKTPKPKVSTLSDEMKANDYDSFSKVATLTPIVIPTVTPEIVPKPKLNKARCSQVSKPKLKRSPKKPKLTSSPKKPKSTSTPRKPRSKSKSATQTAAMMSGAMPILGIDTATTSSAIKVVDTQNATFTPIHGNFVTMKIPGNSPRVIPIAALTQLASLKIINGMTTISDVNGDAIMAPGFPKLIPITSDGKKVTIATTSNGTAPVHTSMINAAMPMTSEPIALAFNAITINEQPPSSPKARRSYFNAKRCQLKLAMIKDIGKQKVNIDTKRTFQMAMCKFMAVECLKVVRSKEAARRRQRKPPTKPKPTSKPPAPKAEVKGLLFQTISLCRETSDDNLAGPSNQINPQEQTVSQNNVPASNC